jgi:isovaleryl-CoA dehydrogenase
MDGSWIAGMAMSEPGAGTDVLGMTTTARDAGDHYVLNGTKQWITNATDGDVFLVYAKLDGTNPRSVTSFVVESAWDGFSVGRKETKMGMRQSPTAQLIFEDVHVPKANLLGEPGGALVHMMRNLEIERVTLAAMSCGIARECTTILSRYAIEDRTAFGQPLSAFGQIQRFIGESYARTEAARALVYNVAREVSPERRNSLGAAAAKLVATTTAEEVARNAIQTLGGYGYTREYRVERLLRDAILLSIGGGTNEAMQKNIVSDLRRTLRG